MTNRTGMGWSEHARVLEGLLRGVGPRRGMNGAERELFVEQRHLLVSYFKLSEQAFCTDEGALGFESHSDENGNLYGQIRLEIHTLGRRFKGQTSGGLFNGYSM
jgi:hypothetical protein